MTKTDTHVIKKQRPRETPVCFACRQPFTDADEWRAHYDAAHAAKSTTNEPPTDPTLQLDYDTARYFCEMLDELKSYVANEQNSDYQTDEDRALNTLDTFVWSQRDKANDALYRWRKQQEKGV